MSNETCTVTIADIYGAEWWERNKAELDREWEWSFGVSGDRDHCLATGWGGIKSLTAGIYEPHSLPHIILHRRKPRVPTLREVYEVDEVKIPAGWEWTGGWRAPVVGDRYVAYGTLNAALCTNVGDFPDCRLILRERPKKVWFKAEEKTKAPKPTDWVWCCLSGQWVRWDMQASMPDLSTRLCATRHEDIDQTVQVVTQADIDKVTR
jgi:hypothetical protein